MLLELHARDIGVIADLTLVFEPGMTAVTGETGAGKTLVVEAIELLMGERAEPLLVRAGADEARVEGRFALPGGEGAGDEGDNQGGGEIGEKIAERIGEEIVLARVVPRRGRSRAYIDGRLASAGELVELGRRLVDLHGQHAHQSLLGPRVQRDALDRFGAVDLGPLRAARARLAALDTALAALGGDERARAREIDLLRYQLAELDAAAIDGPDEDERLEVEEDSLADAAAHREAAESAYRAVIGGGIGEGGDGGRARGRGGRDGDGYGDGGVRARGRGGSGGDRTRVWGGSDGDDDADGAGGAMDALGAAVAALAGRRPFGELEQRLRGLVAEVAEAGADLRRAAEAVVVDPERLDEVRARRRLLADLRRKYGERLSDVLDFELQARAQLADLEQHGERARALAAERAEVAEEVARAAAAVAAARRQAAPALAQAVEARLQELAMAGARFDVAVEGADPADDVTFLLAANRGAPPLPLAKVASGGELARAMLALRLALGPATAAPAATLVFDEVDAGIGGQAALAVGRALAALATGEGSPERQVLVVTHLPQVAAFADHQVAVSKEERGGQIVATARRLWDEERVVELSRMLSGQPSSATARDHAQELLATASQQKNGSA